MTLEKLPSFFKTPPSQNFLPSIVQKVLAGESGQGHSFFAYGRVLEILRIPLYTQQCSDRTSEQGMVAPWRAHSCRLRSLPQSPPQSSHSKKIPPAGSPNPEGLTFTISLILFYLLRKLLTQHIPNRSRQTYRRVCTTDYTYHQRQCKFPNAGNA